MRAGHAAGATVAALKGVAADLRLTDLTDLTAAFTPSTNGASGAQ